MTGFQGFTAEALDFYEDLEADNTKSFWTAHKDVWERAVRDPMAALTAELAQEFGDAKIFRPYRDVRFSKDKTPYKTHHGASCDLGASAAGVYVQVSAEGLLVAGGCYETSPDQVERFRLAVDDQRSGRALARIVENLRDAGHTIAGQRLKTRPRGFDEDHPRIELLRHKTLHAWRSFGSPDWLATAETRAVVADAWREYGPLIDWFGAQVGPARSSRSAR